jgi:transposase-like protein
LATVRKKDKRTKKQGQRLHLKLKLDQTTSTYTMNLVQVKSKNNLPMAVGKNVERKLVYGTTMQG